jgi:hypothetical protein
MLRATLRSLFVMILALLVVGACATPSQATDDVSLPRAPGVHAPADSRGAVEPSGATASDDDVIPIPPQPKQPHKRIPPILAPFTVTGFVGSFEALYTGLQALRERFSTFGS